MQGGARVSPPRRTVGTDPAGRLPAAMLRALAAELSDPGRFSRAKAYARDGAVVDIEIEPGEVRGQVQGSRYEPYEVSIHTEPARDGEGLLGLIPERNELFSTCSCPDAATFGTCKHGLAVLLVLADEVSIDTAVLERWRSAHGAGDEPRRDIEEDEREALIDVLAAALTAPGALPTIPAIPPRVPIAMAATPGTRDADIAAAVANAIAALRSR